VGVKMQALHRQCTVSDSNHGDVGRNHDLNARSNIYYFLPSHVVVHPPSLGNSHLATTVAKPMLAHPITNVGRRTRPRHPHEYYTSPRRGGHAIVDVR
jgi:hypothetical protein